MDGKNGQPVDKGNPYVPSVEGFEDLPDVGHTSLLPFAVVSAS